jgi:hypothetical protein
MSLRRLSPVSGVLLVALGGCGPPQPTSTGGVSIAQAYSPTVKACVLGVADTRAEVVDTLDGSEVVFKTSPDNLVELRSRVFDQAAMHGPDAHAGAGHGGVHGAGQAHGLRLWDMPVLRARSIDVEGGARLQVAASDPAHLDELRKRVRERVAKLESKDCP